MPFTRSQASKKQNSIQQECSVRLRRINIRESDPDRYFSLLIEQEKYELECRSITDACIKEDIPINYLATKIEWKSTKVEKKWFQIAFLQMKKDISQNPRRKLAMATRELLKNQNKKQIRKLKRQCTPLKNHMLDQPR